LRSYRAASKLGGQKILMNGNSVERSFRSGLSGSHFVRREG